MTTATATATALATASHLAAAVRAHDLAGTPHPSTSPTGVRVRLLAADLATALAAAGHADLAEATRLAVGASWSDLADLAARRVPLTLTTPTPPTTREVVAVLTREERRAVVRGTDVLVDAGDERLGATPVRAAALALAVDRFEGCQSDAEVDALARDLAERIGREDGRRALAEAAAEAEADALAEAVAGDLTALVATSSLGTDRASEAAGRILGALAEAGAPDLAEEVARRLGLTDPS